MSSIEASPRSWTSSADNSPISSATTSPVALSTPGLSGSLGALTVAPPNTLTRRRLSFDGPHSEQEFQGPPALLTTKEKIGRPDSPPLLAIKGTNANDICFIGSPSKKTNPHTVFKPGKSNTMRAILCSQIAKILDLEPCVPVTIEAKAAQVISKEDLDDRSNPIIYKKVYIDGEPWLANPDDCYLVHSKKKHSLSLFGGCDFTIEEEDDAHNLVPTNQKAEKHALAYEEVLFGTLDGKQHVIKRESAYPITVDNQSPHVKRGEIRLELRASNGDDVPSSSSEEGDLFEAVQGGSADDTEIPENVLLVRKEVDGFLQPMIQNVVTEIDGTAIDIIHIPKTRDSFYSMIRSISFINSVMLAILFRTQDGKAHYLRESNFLFTEHNGKLNLTLIDLDETWPCSNGLSEVPELQEKGDIAALRLGLMGYPQAHMPLQGEDKAHYLSLVDKIANRQAALLSTVEQHKLDNSDRVVLAFREVLTKIAAFSEQQKEAPFSLADLVFHVFPVYKQQWDELSELNLSREEIAASIGYGSVAEQKELAAHMLASMQRNKRK